MGGFDSYAFGIWAHVGRGILEDGTLDGLQSALRFAAPSWTERLRLSHIEYRHVGVKVPIDTPGSMARAIRDRIPGGASWVPDADRPFPPSRFEFSGTPRSVRLELRLEESMRINLPALRKTDWINIEANARTVADEPASVWIERVFDALCTEVQPRVATASTLGERVSAQRRYGDDRESIEWLTFFGPDAVAALDVRSLPVLPPADIRQLGAGLRVRIGDDPGPGRRSGYWRLVDSVTDALGDDAVSTVLSDRAKVTDPRTRDLPPARVGTWTPGPIR